MLDRDNELEMLIVFGRQCTLDYSLDSGNSVWSLKIDFGRSSDDTFQTGLRLQTA